MDGTVATQNSGAIEAAKARIAESQQIDHAARYKFVVATKPQLFGPTEFTDCPQCGKQYRIFNNPKWKGDQSVCQACADENFAQTRDKMQKIERSYAERDLRRFLDGEQRELERESQVVGPFAALSGA